MSYQETNGMKPLRDFKISPGNSWVSLATLVVCCGAAAAGARWAGDVNYKLESLERTVEMQGKDRLLRSEFRFWARVLQLQNQDIQVPVPD